MCLAGAWDSVRGKLAPAAISVSADTGLGTNQPRLGVRRRGQLQVSDDSFERGHRAADAFGAVTGRTGTEPTQHPSPGWGGFA